MTMCLSTVLHHNMIKPMAMNTTSHFSALRFFSRFEEYRRYLSQHLLKSVITHWDIAIREVASEAMARIAVLDLDFACNDIIPALVS